MAGSLYNRLDKLGDEVRGYVPFTRLNMAWRFLRKSSHTILDIGCGAGQPAKFLKSRRTLSIVGVDIWLPALRQAQQTGSHDASVLADIRHLPFRSKSFDVVLALEVIEHLEKEASSEIIRRMEGIARKQVILTTPVGEQEQGTCKGNPHQEHKCFWNPIEIRKQGYKVRGYKLRGMRGKFGGDLLTHFPQIIQLIVTYAVRFIQILPSPLTYFIPEIAGNMLCVKELDTGFPGQ